jgi:predicted exporter
MVALFAFFGFFAVQLHLEEDINKLMPSSKNEDGTTKLAFADLKIKDKVFLLFESQGDRLRESDQDHESVPLVLAEVCDEFVDSLLQRDSVSQTIGDVFFQLDEDLIPNGIDYLTEHLPAYIDTSAYARFDTLLTREHFVRQMQQNREDLTGEFGEMFPELIQMDPMGMRSVLADQIEPLTSAGGSYKTIEGHFFVPDSTVCIAFITPRYSATNTGQGSAMFQLLNTQIEEFAQKYPEVRISYHGTPASGYYNSTQIKHDLTTTIAGALALVLVFLLFCFRRWDTIPLLLLPVAFGTVFGLAMMYWLKGEFSLLALGIGGVVLGVALSYVLHVLTHQQFVGDTERLLSDQVKPVLLGCLTTIGSFAGLLFVKTDLLRDFGLFAAFAILGTTLFSLIWLPQMLREKARSSTLQFFNSSLVSYPFDRKKPLIVVILLITVVCVGAFFVGGTRFDADMHNLGYDHPLTEHSEQLLRDKTYTNDKTKYFASQGRTMEEAIENFALLDSKLDSLQRLGLVKSYTRTSQIFVPQRQQQERIEAWKQYWTDERLAQVRRLIAETAPLAGMNAEAFGPFFETATRDYQPDALYDADIIPTGYQSTLTEQSYGGDYLVFTSVRCLNDSVRSSESDYMRICDAIAKEPNLLVLDTYYYTTDTLIEMSEDFNLLQWLSMAFVLIVLWLSFHFNGRHTLLAFAPILLSWLIVLGVMVLFDVQFNLISIIISTFIFGIGVDYSIFIMHGLTSDDQKTVNAQLSTLNCHKTAILLSAVVLITTVSSMLLARHPAIRSVGFTTLVGLLAAVILSYVLQPAIFRWMNGKLKN